MSPTTGVDKTPHLSLADSKVQPAEQAPARASRVEDPHAIAPSLAFVEAAESQEYRTLRSTFRNFAFPMTAAALVSYFTYVVLSIYAVDFMAQPLFGLEGINLGIGLSLVQFAVVWTWTAIYVRYMDKRVDPTAGSLRTRLENGAGA